MTHLPEATLQMFNWFPFDEITMDLNDHRSFWLKISGTEVNLDDYPTTALFIDAADATNYDLLKISDVYNDTCLVGWKFTLIGQVIAKHGANFLSAHRASIKTLDKSSLKIVHMANAKSFQILGIPSLAVQIVFSKFPAVSI
jgi:hypothetical protein